MSRDPVEPTEQQPEAMNPYQAMYNNTYVYSDSSGMFTNTEFDAAISLQDALQATRTYAGNQAKEYLKQRIGDAFSEVVASVFKNFMLGGYYAEEFFKLLSAEDNRTSKLFEEFLVGTFCEFFEGVPL